PLGPRDCRPGIHRGAERPLYQSFKSIVMTTEPEIEKCVLDFIRAGDHNDVPALDRVLHKLYQNVQDGFFERQGLFRFSKADYKKLVGEKTFGGVPRSIDIRSIEEFGQHMALVRVRLESNKL